ncbi:MAG: acetate--CoA ligase family protein, partial [Anaerolineae bacterium]|nr:acetate--CoA ligase family protein [Anaerolineae bacterium]
MKLHEYQSKRIFAKYGVPIPEGEVATTPAEAREIAHQIGGSVVVKSQVLVGGRGKAGGVKVAKDADEAEQLAKQILGMDIKGLTVEKVLIDPTADIRDEIYIGVVIDRAQQKPVIIASAEGGVEIEIVAKENPDAIKRVAVDPVFGLMNFQATNLAYDLGLKGHYVGQFTKIIKGLYQAFMDTDASLAEINPLVVTGDEQLLAVDGKIVLDDNALYKHPDLAEMRDIQEESPS